MNERRAPDSPRRPVKLTVKLRYRNVDELVQHYATNFSAGGLFIKTSEPKPPGTKVEFRLLLAHGDAALEGGAIVKWARKEGDPGGPPGMGLEFERLDAWGEELVRRMREVAHQRTETLKPVPVLTPAVRPAVIMLGPAPEPPKMALTAPITVRLDAAPTDAVQPAVTIVEGLRQSEASERPPEADIDAEFEALIRTMPGRKD